MAETTGEDKFERLDRAAAAGVEQLFEALGETLLAEKRYAQYFDASLMMKRWQLGLPVEGTEDLRGLTEAQEIELENAYIDLCRRVGRKFLEDGDIRGAWPYFRAIDEPGPVAEALEAWTPTPEEGPSAVEAMVDIALREGAHPRRGFELLLGLRGPERAAEAIDRHLASPSPARARAIELFVRRVYEDLVAKVREDISRRESVPPSEARLRELVADRPDLFETKAFHLDEPLLRAAVRLAASSDDREILELGEEIADYGRRFPRAVGGPEEAPFEDFFADARILLLALLGRGADGAVRYFEAKADRAYPGAGGKHVPGEVLVTLLDRLGRYAAAIDAYRKYLSRGAEIAPTVPKLLDLSAKARDFRAFLEEARNRDDLVGYSLALLVRGRARGDEPERSP
ncbi:MAG: hypothetical protein ACUVYA_12960 [Planctomycetota bacterium]